MRWPIVLLLIAGCSPTDPDPAVTRVAPDDQVPTLSESQKHDVMREIVEKAGVPGDAGPTCGVPPTIEDARVIGKLSVVTFGGKTTHNAVGDLHGGQLAILAGATIRRGRTNLAPRRDTQDFSRPLVVEIGLAGRGLDAVSGTVVIDQVKPMLSGHLENATFRERGEDLAYVADGCTTQAARIDFQFTLDAR